MMESIAQFALPILAAGFEDWGDLLFIIVIMVFSAIGGLVKSISAKKSQQQGGRASTSSPGPPQRMETWQQRLARKAQQVQRAMEAKYAETQQRPPGEPSSGAQAPPGKLSVRTKRGGESIMVYEQARGESIAEQQAARQRQAREAVALARRREAERTIPARRSRESGAATMPAAPVERSIYTAGQAQAPAEPADSLAPPIIDYDDPEALKRAILQLEILGRPLALRDPLAHDSAY